MRKLRSTLTAAAVAWMLHVLSPTCAHAMQSPDSTESAVAWRDAGPTCRSVISSSESRNGTGTGEAVLQMCAFLEPPAFLTLATDSDHHTASGHMWLSARRLAAWSDGDMGAVIEIGRRFSDWRFDPPAAQTDFRWRGAFEEARRSVQHVRPRHDSTFWQSVVTELADESFSGIPAARSLLFSIPFSASERLLMGATADSVALARIEANESGLWTPLREQDAEGLLRLVTTVRGTEPISRAALASLPRRQVSSAGGIDWTTWVQEYENSEDRLGVIHVGRARVLVLMGRRSIDEIVTAGGIPSPPATPSLSWNPDPVSNRWLGWLATIFVIAVVVLVFRRQAVDMVERVKSLLDGLERSGIGTIEAEATAPAAAGTTATSEAGMAGAAETGTSGATDSGRADATEESTTTVGKPSRPAETDADQPDPGVGLAEGRGRDVKHASDTFPPEVVGPTNSLFRALGAPLYTKVWLLPAHMRPNRSETLRAWLARVLKESKSRIRDLEQELGAFEQELDAKERELAKMESKVRNLKEEIDAKNEEMDSKTALLETTEVELGTVKSDNEDLRTKLESASAQIRETQEEAENLKLKDMQRVSALAVRALREAVDAALNGFSDRSEGIAAAALECLAARNLESLAMAYAEGNHAAIKIHVASLRSLLEGVRVYRGKPVAGVDNALSSLASLAPLWESLPAISESQSESHGRYQRTLMALRDSDIPITKYFYSVDPDGHPMGFG